jgi:hypothetical protein
MLDPDETIKNLDIVNPFENLDENLEWLELDDIPEHLPNPLNFIGNGEVLDPVSEMVGVFLHPDYLHFAARMLLRVELAPYQAVILDVLWKKRFPMLIGSRGAAKSYIMAIYALLRMIFHPGCHIVIVGAGLRQSRNVFDYMARIWSGSDILRDIAGKSKTAGPRREVDRYQFELGNSRCFGIPLGTGEKIRGLRANYILADEFDSINEEIFNVVVQGFGIVASSPIEKMKEAAMINKLKKLDVWTEQMEALRRERTGGNQIVYSGTAGYAFKHFYKYFTIWKDIIYSKGNTDRMREIFGDSDIAKKGFNYTDYGIIRLPYKYVPEGILDSAMLAQAKATLTPSQFNMEYGACFARDSDGFFKRSVLEAATTNKPITLPSGKVVQFNAINFGDPQRRYVIGVDPAADKDNAAIVTLELHEEHRRVVNCWTTNRKKYNELKKKLDDRGEELEPEYYRYIARKIRDLMKNFNTERIIMDKNGGGIGIAEALSNPGNCQTGELPIYELIDPENPKANDMKEGLHILELITPTNDINAEANHGMLKDLQSKTLLFPMFDSIEIAKSIEVDYIEGNEFDTYEDLIYEIEELKSEIASIVVTGTSTLGKENFDTPQIKGTTTKKGRLRKDRYSALLYANFYSRNKNKQEHIEITYKAVGGTKDTLRNVRVQGGGSNQMYYGPGMLRFGAKANKAAFMQGHHIKVLKHRR